MSLLPLTSGVLGTCSLSQPVEYWELALSQPAEFWELALSHQLLGEGQMSAEYGHFARFHVASAGISIM